MQWTLWIFMITFCGLNSVQSQERVAPGVPPQHYQQPPSYQGQNMHQVPHQQIPQHQLSQHQVPHQQIPQHQIPQQQVPQHQIPQQQMHQQHQVPQVQQIPEVQQAPTIQQHIPVTNAGTHEHAHSHHDQILNAANADHEKGHIAKHFDVPIDTSKMSEQELQFHYFKMHDSDNNNKLDGCELIKSLIHWHEGDPTNTGEKIFTDEELVALIDPILAMDDTNKDGFIDYPEFVQAQQKGAPAAGQQ